ncbi:MAG: mitoguardin, partial [Bacteroides sp.]|nr:mitoguardin [Bacteroides sp.]
MKTNLLAHGFIACCLFSSFICADGFAQTVKNPFARSPIVAKRTGQLVTAELKALKDTINLPLSQLTEELQIVKLDNRDEALIGGWTRTTIGKKHILISNNKQTPYKLFDRNGKFLTNIGSYGQGPNEYLNTYAEQLDEERNRIYILPWQSDKLLVFDLKGQPQPPIPLGARVPKGQFRVDGAKSEVTVTALPFKGSAAVVWVQDFKGKRKKVVAPKHLEVPQDFSNEVLNDNNAATYNVMLAVIMPPRIDSLYHYNPTANNLMLTTAEEAECIKNIEDILEAAYNLQDASEMLFIHQNSVLNKRELALQAKKELLYDRAESAASGGKESLKHRRVISISSLEEVSFVSAQDTVADLRDFDDLAELDTEKLALYQSALDTYESSGIEYRVLRTEFLGCSSDTEYLGK